MFNYSGLSLWKDNYFLHQLKSLFCHKQAKRLHFPAIRTGSDLSSILFLSRSSLDLSKKSSTGSTGKLKVFELLSFPSTILSCLLMTCRERLNKVPPLFLYVFMQTKTKKMRKYLANSPLTLIFSIS